MQSKIEGKVIAVADDGNLITDITSEALAAAPRDERVIISCDEHQTCGIFSPTHDQPVMTLIAMLGERNLLEICIVGDSAAIMLGVAPGAPVTVGWA